MSKNDGDPAFPSDKLNIAGDFILGMTLRDYFAAQAMQGMLANGGVVFADAEILAGFSYKTADEMLKERDK